MIPRETASFFLDTDEINGILGGSIEAIFRTKPVAKPFDVIHIDGRAFHIVSVTALPLSEDVPFEMRIRNARGVLGDIHLHRGGRHGFHDDLYPSHRRVRLFQLRQYLM